MRLRRQSAKSSGLHVAGLALTAFLSAVALAADHPACGRLAGMVTDRDGTPLVNATVVIMGPGITRRVERVLTDAHGRFSAGDLLPGRYSLAVASTHLQRDGIDIRAGQVSELSLMLSTLLPQITRSREGANHADDDWKSVLRSASSVRPVLRYHGGASGSSPVPLDPGQRLVAMIPESAGADVLSDQVDLGTVLAYWRPLTQGTDVLVASALAGEGVSNNSLISSFRRRAASGSTQQVALIAHQLGFGGGIVGPGAPPALLNVHGMTLAYSDAQEISSALRLETGFEVNYLDGFQGTVMVMPRAEVEYILSPLSSLKLSYGDAPVSPDGSLAQAVEQFNEFPRISMQNDRARLEAARHSQVTYSRRLTRKTQVQASAYHDGFSNAVVRGFGPASAWSSLAAAGDVMPNATSNGVNLDAGGYGSTGVRVSISQSLTRNLQASASYSTGDALTAIEAAHGASSLPVIRPHATQMVDGKMIAEIPATKTEVITSYGWIERGQVTAVDPYALADLNVAPYAGVQIRQPLPRINFLGGTQIQMIADFRNVGGQGYIRMTGANGQPITLTPVYRSFRGGFSVQF